MAPPAKGGVARFSPAGGAVDPGGAAAPLPPAGSGAGLHWSEACYRAVVAHILADGPAWGRGRRVLVAGTASAAASGPLARSLGQGERSLWLDLTGWRDSARPGLAEVILGTVPLSGAILSREAGADRLGGGRSHPDVLIRRPHGLAIVLDALGSAYASVVISVPERGESLIGEVLASVSDATLLAPAPEDPAVGPDRSAFAARGRAPIAAVGRDGRAAWLERDVLRG